MSRVLSAPRVAWPTLALAIAALALWCVAIEVMASEAGPGEIACVALAVVGAYLAFTPLHEAAHRSLARARWVNELVGRIASIPLLGPFPAVRFLHLEHHKHTNEPAADPDHWSGRGPRWTLPLRWLTQDLHYYWVYARRPRPASERIEVVVTFVVFVVIASAIGRAALLYWILPARLAIGVLVYALDYVPHRPHQITSREDRYRATSAREGRLVFAVTLGQSLHLVHHLYPGVPFYRYGRVWRDRVRDRNLALRCTSGAGSSR